MAENPAISDVRFQGLDQGSFVGAAFDLVAPTGLSAEDPFMPQVLMSFGAPSDTVSTPTEFLAVLEGGSLGDTWYEIIHVFPFRFDLGNILTTIENDIIIYNADRFSSHTLDAFTNDAGAGITIDDLPALPYTLESQSGVTVTLTVSPDGPPSIDGNLEFEFDLYTILLALTGQRIVMFPFEPESPLEERLRFLTDILEHKDGTEQRIALRKNPRQEFPSFTVFREEGEELTRLDMLLFDWQARVFGLPVWAESTTLTADASASDTIVSVETTSYADYRVGGIAIFWVSETEYEALEIAAIGSSTITLASPLAGNFAAGTLVMPIRTAISSSRFKGIRYPVNAAKRTISFSILDNDVGDSFADATPFTVSDGASVIDGEILLDGYNRIESVLQEDFSQNIVLFDGDVGKFSHTSTVDYNRRGSSHTFLIKNRADLWSVRRLLHRLRGRQVSFIVPTNFKDLTVTQPANNGSPLLIVRHVGITQFSQLRNRFKLLRIELTNGTVFDVEVTATSEISSSEEQLTLSKNFTVDLSASQFRRVDFYERVRIDSDDVTIQHLDSGGQAIVSFPIKSTIT